MLATSGDECCLQAPCTGKARANPAMGNRVELVRFVIITNLCLTKKRSHKLDGGKGVETLTKLVCINALNAVVVSVSLQGLVWRKSVLTKVCIKRKFPFQGNFRLEGAENLGLGKRDNINLN